MNEHLKSKALDLKEKVEQNTGNEVMAVTLSGSRLYRLESPTSDYDYVVITKPHSKDILLNKKVQNRHSLVELDGKVEDVVVMPVTNFISGLMEGKVNTYNIFVALTTDKELGLLWEEESKTLSNGLDGLGKLFTKKQLNEIVRSTKGILKGTVHKLNKQQDTDYVIKKLSEILRTVRLVERGMKSGKYSFDMGNELVALRNLKFTPQTVEECNLSLKLMENRLDKFQENVDNWNGGNNEKLDEICLNLIVKILID